MSSLYTLDVNPLLGISFANFFFHSGGSLLILFMALFATERPFGLNGSVCLFLLLSSSPEVTDPQKYC